MPFRRYRLTRCKEGSCVVASSVPPVVTCLAVRLCLAHAVSVRLNMSQHAQCPPSHSILYLYQALRQPPNIEGDESLLESIFSMQRQARIQGRGNGGYSLSLDRFFLKK